MPTLLADAQNLLAELIARYSPRVDYLVIRLEEAEGTDILLRGDKVETLSEGISIGGQIRACYKGGWGLSSFNQLATKARSHRRSDRRRPDSWRRRNRACSHCSSSDHLP